MFDIGAFWSHVSGGWSSISRVCLDLADFGWNRTGDQEANEDRVHDLSKAENKGR